MKKNVLSLAVAAGVVGLASAAHADMYINPNGTGEQLFYPFYSAQNGNDTLIHVANTTNLSKAVKVRIKEAENSAEVLDFHLYLSPEDHFSFVITATADGAELRTVDNSCTVPAIPDSGNGYKAVAFKNFDYAADRATGTAAFDNTSLARSRIGYVEIIEMGQLDPTSPFHADIVHTVAGTPADCGDLVESWSIVNGVTGTWLAEYATDTTPDTGFLAAWNGGGLYGFGSVLNVADGTAFGFDAVAIDGVVDTTVIGVDGGALHYLPGDTDPSVNDTRLSTTSVVTDNGSSYINQYAAPVFATNSLFMATEIINDFVVDPALNASTDWVITFPTKRPHVQAATNAATINPFSVRWDGRGACEPFGLSYVDREELANVVSQGPQFSPAPPTPTASVSTLCYETTVVKMGASSAVNVDSAFLDVSAGLVDPQGAPVTEGWASISFAPQASYNLANSRVVRPVGATVANPGLQQTGLPAIGFAAIKYQNGALAGGALANYAFTTDHKIETVTSVVTS